MEDQGLPRVAIITVYYNRSNNVEESISSLIGQTYPNLDIIIVDDCSKDNTFLKLQEMEQRDNRIRLLRNHQNKGFTNTLIDTIEELDTSYVAIHGAGDISMPTRVEEQVKYLEENQDVGVVTTDLVNKSEPSFTKCEITTEDLLQRNYVFHGAVMFSLRRYREVGGYRRFFKTRQDFDLWTRMSLITKIHFMPRKLYKLVTINDSVSQDAGKSLIPTLLSMFVHFSIRERLSGGFDSLDRYGEHAGLIFNPSQCNRLLRMKIVADMRRGEYDNCVIYIDHLIKLNYNSILVISFKFFRFLFSQLAKIKSLKSSV